VKLTDRNVAVLTLPAGKVEAIHFDDDIAGFGVRVRAGGSRSFIYQYKIAGQNRRITLGATKALTAARARDLAADLAAKVRLGADPAGEKAENRLAAADTFGAALKAYLPEKHAGVRPATFVAIERHLMARCRDLHPLPLVKIDRHLIASTLNVIATDHGPIEANRARSSLSSFFGWVIAQGLLDSGANPVAGTQSRPERSRDRVLSVEELRSIWAVTEHVADDNAVAPIVRLMLLTGQRGGEIAGLRWDEVYDDRIVLSSGRVKNGREHVVPLSPAARAIIAVRPRTGTHVFGRTGDGDFRGWSKAKVWIDARLATAGITLNGEWTFHDLRRSLATHMAEQGIAQPFVIEAILNHVTKGVAGIYNRALYAEQKTAALHAWADFILGTADSKVVKLERKVR
jgi:integrase